MPTPSLILVPARFKTGKLYTPLATTSGGVVLGASGDFNVTRATTATRVNASGLIEIVASGIPRLDYYTSGGTAGCPALLVEPAGTNLAWHSHLWVSGSNWSNAQVVVVTGTSGTIDPFGTNLANAISPTVVNTTHIAQSNSPTTISYTSGTIYTQSAFFKQGTGVAGRYVQMTFPGAGGAFTQLGYANFDLQLGAVTVVTGTTADTNRAGSIENYGNGWYRCRFTATCNATITGLGVAAILITASGSTRAPSFSGTTTDILYGFGAQVETGSIATSYIPTTAAAVTRNADNISLSSAVSGCIGQTQGTIYAEFEIRSDTTTRRLFALSDGTQSNRVFLYYTSNALRAQIQATDISLGNPAAGYHKVAFAYQQSGVSGTLFASLDGGAVVSGTTAGTFPSVLNAVFIGKRESSTDDQQWNARIRSAAIYTSRLSNAELIALSTL
jgi:hypothetical protein